MEGKEIKYAIAFDANKEFKEIRMMDDQSEPLAVGQGSVYVLTRKEFKKLAESAMRRLRLSLGDLDDFVAANVGEAYYVVGAFGEGGGKRGKPSREGPDALTEKFATED